MATHSSTVAWKIPWMEEPGGLQSMGSLRVGHDWATSLSLFTFMHWRKKWQSIPVFLPGESQGQGSLVGYHLWGCRVRHDWGDLEAAAAAECFKQTVTRSNFTKSSAGKLLKKLLQAFPCGSVVKNLSPSAGDATKSLSHNYWACALEPGSHNY